MSLTVEEINYWYHALCAYKELAKMFRCIGMNSDEWWQLSTTINDNFIYLGHMYAFYNDEPHNKCPPQHIRLDFSHNGERQWSDPIPITCVADAQRYLELMAFV